MANPIPSILFLVIMIITSCQKKKVKILGEWRDVEDENSCLIIKPQVIYFIYKNDTISSNEYKLTDISCDSSYLNVENTKFEFLVLDDGNCYELTGLSDTSFAYRHTGSGKLHVFDKMKGFQK